LPRDFCRLLGLGCPKQAFAKIVARLSSSVTSLLNANLTENTLIMLSYLWGPLQGSYGTEDLKLYLKHRKIMLGSVLTPASSL